MALVIFKIAQYLNDIDNKCSRSTKIVAMPKVIHTSIRRGMRSDAHCGLGGGLFT